MKGDVTQLLLRWGRGDRHALEDLMPRVYDQLRSLAAARLRRERADHTLEPTELVNEAFLRLIDQNRVTWESRGHFFGIAARMMRRILVDHARKLAYAKRGGDQQKVELGEALVLSKERAPELLALDDALESLAAIAPRQAQVVELRHFGGMTRQEIATVLGISVPTVARHWSAARAWLYRHLEGSVGHQS